jgi:hypothetical protein
LDGPSVFAPDILGRQLDIEHGGVNLGMTHQVHESGQGDSGAHHVSSKGVAETMRVGLWDLTAQTMVTEQRAEPSWSHGLSATAPFQGNKQGGRISQRSFQPQIVLQDFDGFHWQWQNALLIALAQNAKFRLRQLEILELESQDFMGTQAIQEHQSDQREITEGTEALPELSDLFGREGHNDSARLP